MNIFTINGALRMACKLWLIFFFVSFQSFFSYGALSDTVVCESLYRKVGVVFSKNKVLAQAALNACGNLSSCQYASGSLETADQIKQKFNQIGEDSCKNIPQAKAKGSALYIIYDFMPTCSLFERDVKVKVARFLGIDYTDLPETDSKKQTKMFLEEYDSILNENKEMRAKLTNYDVLIQAIDQFINATIHLRQALEQNGKKPTEATCKNLNNALQSYNESKAAMNAAAKKLKLDLATIKYDTVLEILAARTASSCSKK